MHERKWKIMQDIIFLQFIVHWKMLKYYDSWGKLMKNLKNNEIGTKYTISLQIKIMHFAGPLHSYLISCCSSPWWSGLQGSRNVGIPRMDLDTEETHETHNLYMESTRLYGSLKNISFNYLLLWTKNLLVILNKLFYWSK